MRGSSPRRVRHEPSGHGEIGRTWSSHQASNLGQVGGNDSVSGLQGEG